ncbi:MAG: flippase-like domain-containing protein, partial [Acidobacteriota bacterium]
MKRVDRQRAWPLLLLGLVLAVGLLAVARPQHVVQLAIRAQPSGLAAAFAVTAAVAALRGLRLKVVVGRSLGALRALAVHAVTQFAAAVVPMRLGEAATLPLLHRAGVPGLLRGVSVVVTVRLLDLLALLVWATVAGLWLGARGALAGTALVIVAATVLAVAAVVQRFLAAAARRYRHASPRWRRVLRQALQVRAELKRLVATPGRAAAAMALSLAAWGGVWWVTVLLLRAMGLVWPAATVLWGTLGATLGAALPLNAVGNFGTLEAGWTAALTALGIPASQALAAGFATHAWSLLFNAALAAAALNSRLQA